MPIAVLQIILLTVVTASSVLLFGLLAALVRVAWPLLEKNHGIRPDTTKQGGPQGTPGDD